MSFVWLLLVCCWPALLEHDPLELISLITVSVIGCAQFSMAVSVGYASSIDRLQVAFI